jgi:hypothetical protein
MIGSRRSLQLLVAAGFVLMLSASSVGQVDGSKHDFSGEHAGDRRSGVCTFCHTPHRAIRTGLVWNHTLATNVYGWSKATTDSGTRYPTITTTWPGSAPLCLSCHDGSVAIGDLAWFNGESWTGRPIDDETHNGDDVQIGTVNGDLSNNHPISFPYPFAGVASTYNGVTTSSGALAQGWVADPSLRGIRLFREFNGAVVAGTQPGSTGIECATCHDPHDNPANVEDDPLLRGSTDADDTNYICTKCHLVMGDYKRDESLHPHRRR